MRPDERTPSPPQPPAEPTQARRLLGFRVLRVLNLICVILSFWPLLLLTVMLLGFGGFALLEHWRRPQTTGLDLLLLAIPAFLAYAVEPRLIARDPDHIGRPPSGLQGRDDGRLPERSSELRTERALAEAAAAAARREAQLERRAELGIRGWLRSRAVPALRQIAWFGLSALALGLRGLQLSPIYALVLALLAAIAVKLAIDAPDRGYNEIYRLPFYVAFLIFSLLNLLLAETFRLEPYLNLHIALFFFISMVYLLTRNQVNIDSVMRRGHHALDELPRGLRQRNAVLVLLLAATIPVIYLLRRVLAAAIVWTWDLVRTIIRVVLDFLGSLLRPGEERLQPIPTESLPEEGQLPPAQSGSWLWDLIAYAILAGIITLLFLKRRQIAAAIGNGLRRLRDWLSTLMQREVTRGEDVERHSLYSDFHSSIDPGRHQRLLSERRRRRRWQQACRHYFARYGVDGPVGREQVRHAYRLLLGWLDLCRGDLKAPYTVRETTRHNLELLSRAADFDAPTREALMDLYEWARYDRETTEESQASGPQRREALDHIEARIRALSQQRGAIDARLGRLPREGE